MRDLEAKVAVITGGASGIGKGMATRFASEGMKLVLADIEEEALSHTVAEFRSKGAQVMGVPTDVSDQGSVEALADAAYEAHGFVDVLCNNAGVGAGGLMWQTTHDDWEWVIGVNLWGVVHGILSFVPRMVDSGREGHVVNTSSMAGLVAAPGMGIYSATKFAVVAISESLYHELKMAGSKVGVSVLCPGWVNTNILDASRNRPADLSETVEIPDGADQALAFARKLIESGMDPVEVGGLVVDAIRSETFYVFTHPEWMRGVEKRVEALVAGEPPVWTLQS